MGSVNIRVTPEFNEVQARLLSLSLQISGAGNDELKELKKLLQDEVRLRKAAEDEIYNLKNQLLKFSKHEVWYL